MNSKTKVRLFEAACKIFAERGYEESTVQMIAESAGANIAAINYHFGSKADLFAEYVGIHIKESMEKMPRLEHDPADPEGQMRKLVHWFFERLYPDAPLRRLNQDITLLKPDFADAILESVILPEFQNCRELVSAILPSSTPEPVIRCWIKSIISLCTGPLHGAPIYPKAFRDVPYDVADIQLHADHVANVIIRGLEQEAEHN